MTRGYYSVFYQVEGVSREGVSGAGEDQKGEGRSLKEGKKTSTTTGRGIGAREGKRRKNQ